MANFFIENVYWTELDLCKLGVNYENRSELSKFVFLCPTLYYLYGDNVHDRVTKTGRKPLSANITWHQLYIKNPNTAPSTRPR